VACLIPYRAVNFPSTSFLEKELKTNWHEIVHAGITVGRASLSHVTLHGLHSSFEIFHKISLIYSYLKSAVDGHLLRSEAYDGLDPSEKSGVSYFIGILNAKLFSSHLLGVRFLSHLDVYRNFPDPRYRIKPSFFYGGKKPDLVGQNEAGDWIAIEAKGRTNRFEPWVISNAKMKQLANLRSINGNLIALKVAVLAYFEGGVLNVHLEDPQEINPNAKNLALPDREVFAKHWYEPFINLVKFWPHQIRRERGREYLAVEFAGLDSTVGIDRRIFDFYDRDTGDPPEPVQTSERIHTDRALIGEDGIYVELGDAWNIERMMREPFERAPQ
jgi:hypothetical protein